MSEHTPGPWIATRIGPRRGPVRLTDRTFKIAPVEGPAFVYLPEGRDDIQQANARLIAAAPELLSALRTLANLGDSGIRQAVAAALRPNERASFAEAIEAARAAIANATGAQP